MTSFQKTREALAVYDANEGARQALWDNAADVAGLLLAEKADKEAEELVQAALYEDTSAFNCRENCALVHPNDPWLRELVKPA